MMTKNIFLLLFAVCSLSDVLYSQAFVVNQNDTVLTCSGSVFDSGVDSSGYSGGEGYTYTICSSSPGLKTNLEFQIFNLNFGDTLCIYDGMETNEALLLGCYTTSQILSGTNFTSNEGCLTLAFNSQPGSSEIGWDAQISCVNCQKIYPELLTSPMYDTLTSFLDICMGDTVFFESNTQYPENNTSYNQHDSTSTFEYLISGEVYTTENFSHTFSFAGYYPLLAEVTDLNGCKAQKAILAVRVSDRPNFAGTLHDPFTGYCVGDTLAFDGQAQTHYVSYNFETYGDPVYLPDGAGDSYTTSITLNNFQLNQQVSSVDDIQSICVDMEHSYMGDLEIEIICPNGSSVVLLSYPNAGNGTFLGGAIDNDNDNPIAGEGFTYCWQESSSNGTMSDFVIANLSDTLPAGSYQSENSFSTLIGCPLNGEWQLQITDNLNQDNGFVFGWSIQIDPSLYPDSIGFQNTITDSWWQTPLIDSIAQDSFVHTVIQNGTNSFVYYVIDDFGCVYDTTLNIQASPSPEISFSADNECFNTQPFVFNNNSNVFGTISNLTWEFGDGQTSNIEDPQHTYANTGNYFVTLSITNQYGCSEDSTREVKLFEIPEAQFTTEIKPGCDSVQVLLTNLSEDALQYQWRYNGNLYSQEKDISITMPYEAVYQLNLVAINNICRDAQSTTDTLLSFDDYYKLLIPNVFTPNGDKLNEVFSIKDGHLFTECTNYQIFNRWGKKVFESSKDQAIWSGKDLEAGTYFYVVEFKGKEYSGEITLLR